MHGTKDGKIVIENVHPHTTGGGQVILDETFKPHGEFKATEHGPICPECMHENHHESNFCNKCGTKLMIVE
jgi:hypothetical protein